MAKADLIGTGGASKKYLATTLPNQTKLTASYKVEGTTGTVDFFIKKIEGTDLDYLKNYIVVINESRVPETPTDGKIFEIDKAVK